MSSRRPIGYVVEIDGPQLLVNLLEDSRGHVAGHRDGLSTVEQPGDLVGIDAGAETVILRIMTVAFAEPREVHAAGRARPSNAPQEPLRQLRGRVVGFLAKRDGKLVFSPQEWRLPVLGASVYPLSDLETVATIGATGIEAEQIRLGADSRNRAVEVCANIDQVLGRHMAILGSTGQGKTHFVAAVLQQLVRLPKSRIVVFDVNGEYASAFAHLGQRVKITQLGGPNGGLQIPYYALGRHGLSRLLIPSEKAQMPALRFAIEHLIYVEADASGARLVNGANNTLYDDCHTGSAAVAMTDLNAIRNRTAPQAQIWPHMRALSCLATEWYVLSPARNNSVERNAFQYGHIQSMINRVRGLIEEGIKPGPILEFVSNVGSGVCGELQLPTSPFSRSRNLNKL